MFEESFQNILSKTTAFGAWYMQGKWEEGHPGNTKAQRDLFRRNSCPGFLTFWEQIPAAGSNMCKQYKNPKINNERRRQATRKRIKWVQDIRLFNDCQRQNRCLRARPMAHFDGGLSKHRVFFCLICDMHLNGEVQWVDHLAGQKHRRALRAAQEILRPAPSAATLMSMPHALP